MDTQMCNTELIVDEGKYKNTNPNRKSDRTIKKFASEKTHPTINRSIQKRLGKSHKMENTNEHNQPISPETNYILSQHTIKYNKRKA